MLSYSDIQALLLEDLEHKEQEELDRFSYELSTGSDYKLIYNRDCTRKILFHALRIAQQRLIIVCPWLSLTAMDESIFDELENLKCLENMSVEIGFASLNDFPKHINLSQLTIEDIIELFQYREDGWKYSALSSLYYRIAKYNPNYLKLNILGTHEKYLICDDQFAFITSHNLLTSDERSNQKEIGIYIRDKCIIKQLTSHFDKSVSLTPFRKSSFSFKEHFFPTFELENYADFDDIDEHDIPF